MITMVRPFPPRRLSCFSQNMKRRKDDPVVRELGCITPKTWVAGGGQKLFYCMVAVSG